MKAPVEMRAAIPPVSRLPSSIHQEVVDVLFSRAGPVLEVVCMNQFDSRPEFVLRFQIARGLTGHQSPEDIAGS